MLSVDDEDARRDNDQGAGDHLRNRHFGEDHPADNDRPEHVDVVKRCDRRGIGKAVALCQQDLSDASGETDQQQKTSCFQVGHDPRLTGQQKSER